MQENRAPTHDLVAAYLEACRVYPPVSDDLVLQGLVRDLLNFYGSDTTGEHITPANQLIFDGYDEDFKFFVSADAEECEQMLEGRVILRLNELILRT